MESLWKLSIFYCRPYWSLFFFFNDTATTEIYTLSLHDALPIFHRAAAHRLRYPVLTSPARRQGERSEEHTSELQSPVQVVCRLLLDKKNHTGQCRTCYLRRVGTTGSIDMGQEI